MYLASSVHVATQTTVNALRVSVDNNWGNEVSSTVMYIFLMQATYLRKTYRDQLPPALRLAALGVTRTREHSRELYILYIIVLYCTGRQKAHTHAQ